MNAHPLPDLHWSRAMTDSDEDKIHGCRDGQCTWYEPFTRADGRKASGFWQRPTNIWRPLVKSAAPRSENAPRAPRRLPMSGPWQESMLATQKSHTQECDQNRGESEHGSVS